MRTSKAAIQKMGFMFGRGRNNRRDPHRVSRPGGSSVWILEYTVSGRGRIHAAGLETFLDAGDIVLFPPEVPQDYGMEGAHGAWDHLWVCFHPPASWMDLLDWPRSAQGLPRLSIPPELRPRIIEALEDGIRLFHRPLERRQAFALNRLESALLWCDSVNPNASQARMDPRIRSSLEFIHRHAARRLTLAELAHVAVLSPPRFSHLFKEQTGRSPWEILEQQRLSRAEELLLMTGKRVCEIALECGFSSPFYFSRVFSRRFGMGPRAFRGRNAAK